MTTIDGSATTADNNTTPVIAGTASSGTPVGSTITIYADGTQLGTTTTTDAAGNWSYSATSALAGGSHSITATETTANGTSIQSGGYSLYTVAPPTITGVDGVGGSLDNNSSPAITGTATGAPVGTEITVFDGATDLGTVTTSDAAGDWSLTPSSPLPEGPNALTATATAGAVTSAGSTTYLVTIDTTPSPAPALTLDPGSDTGTLGDDLTSIVTPTIDGTGTAGDTITLYDGATEVGTATVGANGSWSVVSSALADGLHTLTAFDTDPAGNVSAASDPLALTIDTTASPAPAGLTLDPGSDTGTLGDDLTNVATPAIDGTGSAGDTITLYDGATEIGTTTVGADGSWSVTSAALADGMHTLTAFDTDPAGNLSGPSGPLALAIDTTASGAPAGLTLDPGSDTGTLGDDLTSTITPTIDGTGTVGDTITLCDGATEVGTATVGVDGNWSVTSAALADGMHTLTAFDTDPAGNVSVASDPLALTIDTMASPAPAALTLDPGSDTGTLGDDLTSVVTPTIDGTGTAGDTITLYDGATEVGTATVGADGSWSVISSALVDGVHTLTAFDTDPAGNVSVASNPRALTIDTTASPAPAGLTLDSGSDTGTRGDDLTNVATPVINGTGSAGDTITLYDGETEVGTATVGADGKWSVTASTLADGMHTLTAVDTDPAGNVSTVSDPLALAIDTTASGAPAGLALDPGSDTGTLGDDLTSTITPTIDGTGTVGDTITLYDGATEVGTTTVGANGSWSVTSAALADGVHTLTAVDTDPAGNVSVASDPLALTIDTMASPAPAGLKLDPGSDTGLLGDDLTKATTPVITGTGTAGDTITLFDGETVVGTATVGANGKWSVTASTLADGVHTLTAFDTDPADNISVASAPLALTIDTTASPMPTGLTLNPGSDSGKLGDDLTNVANPVITGRGTAGDTITLYDGETAVGTATVGANGKWSVTASTLADGLHMLAAVDTDPAGNVSAVAAPLMLTIDTTAPAAPTALAVTPASDSGAVGDDLTNVTVPTISGYAAPGDTVTLYDGKTLVGTTTVNENGTWSVTTSALADGTNPLTAYDTDPAGNVSAKSAPLVLAIDTVAPDVTGVSVSADGTLSLGQAVSFALTMSEPVIVAGGTPTLTLSNGAVAVYDAANSTPDSLVFDYVVAAGDDTPTLSIGSVNLNGASVTDAAGNVADLLGGVSGSIGTVGITTGFHPFAGLVASNPSPDEILTVQVAVKEDIPGAYTHLGIGSMGTDGITYTVTGTAAQVDAALEAVLLSPASSVSGTVDLVTNITDQDGTSSSQLQDTTALGNDLTATTAGEFLMAGSGADTLAANSWGNTLIGGTGNDVLIGSSLGSTLFGGSGSSTFFGVGGNTVIVGGGANDMIAALDGDVTVATKAGGNSLVALSSSTSVLFSQGNDTIVGGSGTAVIRATGDSTLFYQGSGSSVFLGGSGSSTVEGGTGSGSFIDGGTGGGMFAGGSGGNNVIIGGLQSSTIFGGGDGDALFANGSGGTIIAAASGNETLQGATSSGNDVFFGGSGSDFIGLGSGSDTLFAGTGSSTVVAGTGADVFAFVNGRAGGSETILGFKLGTDSLSLQGYADGSAQQALNNATTTQGTGTTPAATTLTLSDNTKITFEGLSSVDQRMLG